MLFSLAESHVNTNSFWIFFSSPHRLLGQVVQALIDYQLWQDRSAEVVFTLHHIPLFVWLIVSLSIVLVVLINEAVKLHEIR